MFLFSRICDRFITNYAQCILDDFTITVLFSVVVEGSKSNRRSKLDVCMLSDILSVLRREAKIDRE